MSERITGEEPTVSAPAGGSAPQRPSAPPSTTPAPHVFGERYEIVGLVGSGGMGTVYRARDKELDEIVALKLLRRDLLGQPGMLERFRQEVKLARRVTHRNVARTYDIGESEGEKFLTMEFVDGEALSSRLSREGTLPLDVVLTLTDAMCAGLSAAHEAGVLHRNLKPDNVLVAKDGRVVLTDFGIARALSNAERTATVGLILGTPAYMAPEQVEGVKDLDARADIYALGAMLYECLTGALAWSGDDVWALAAARLFRPPPDPRERRADLPASLAELVLRCMARRREERFSSAKEVTAALADMTGRTQKAVQAPAAPRGPIQVALETDAKTVAVLPFRNTGNSDDDYFADGLTDDLVDALSMTPGLRVLAKGALARFKGPERDAREIGRELRVNVVVDGLLRRVGETLRVAARVVSVPDGFQLWAKRFDRPEKDILSVSDEAADAIADALTLRRNAPARAAPVDGRTMDLYLRARQIFRLGTPIDVLQAIAIFERALAISPDDPTVLAGYATAELRSFSFDTDASDAPAAEQRGLEAAGRALGLAPHLGEARAALATHQWVLGDPIECARELREAIRVAPSSTEVNELYGRILLEAGEPERGVTILTAVAALDPKMGITAGDLASGDLVRGRALMGDWSLFESALEGPVPALVTPKYIALARLCLWRRDVGAATRLRKIVEASSRGFREVVLQMLDATLPGAGAPQSISETSSGTSGRARRRRALFRQVDTEIFAYRGDAESAVKSLAAADELGLIDVSWLDRCALLDGIRTLPGFVAVRAAIAARARATLDVLEWREATTVT